MGFSRFLLAAALLGLASCLTCKYSDNQYEDRVCSAQNGGTTSCVSEWGQSDPKKLVKTGCSGEPPAGPAWAEPCGTQKCANVGRGVVKCFCAGTGNNKCNLPAFPNNCDPKPEPEPGNGAEGEEAENGADGKVGSVFSVLVATIFAAVI